MKALQVAREAVVDHLDVDVVADAVVVDGVDARLDGV